MAIFVYGSKTPRTFENEMLRRFHQQLLTQWIGQDKNITLIANSLWNTAEIDLVCLVPNGILLIDFKDYSGHVTGTQNGPWLLDGKTEIRGGSRENPFYQLRHYKFAMLDWLKEHNLLNGRDLSMIGAAVLFSGPTSQALDLPYGKLRWFRVTDLNHCAAMIADFAAPGLDVYESDVTAIVKAAGVVPMGDISGYQATAQPGRDNPTGAGVREQQATFADARLPEAGTWAGNGKCGASSASPTPQNSGRQRAPSVTPNAQLPAGPPVLESQRDPDPGKAAPASQQPTATIENGRTHPAMPEPSIASAASAAHHAAARKIRWAVVYLIVAAVIVVASIVFTPLLTRTSRSSTPDDPRVATATTLPETSAQRLAVVPEVPEAAAKVAHRASSAGRGATTAPRIQANQAPFYLGRTVLACGAVAQVTLFKKGTYLNLEAPFPREALTAVVWNSDMQAIESRLGRLDRLAGREVCALGQITQYKKHLQIAVGNARYLRLMR